MAVLADHRVKVENKGKRWGRGKNVTRTLPSNQGT